MFFLVSLFDWDEEETNEGEERHIHPVDVGKGKA